MKDKESLKILQVWGVRDSFLFVNLWRLCADLLCCPGSCPHETKVVLSDIMVRGDTNQGSRNNKCL